MERYDKIEKNGQLGVGTYGIVYKAKDKRTNEIVALKKIKIDMDEEGIPSRTLREVACLRQLKHPNVVVMRDVFQSEGRLYLVFEFVFQDLKKYFDNCKGMLAPNTIQSFTTQLLAGLEYCHVRGVMHRDLKPQNLLITSDGRLKIADFGIARVFVPPIREFSPEVVTLWYRPPELLLGCVKYAMALDVWAVGTILAEMATKKPLFPGDSEIDQIFKIFRMLGTPNEAKWPGVSMLQNWNDDFPCWPTLQLTRFVTGLNPKGIDLLEQLLVLDPRGRLSAREALNHAYCAKPTTTPFTPSTRDKAAGGGGGRDGPLPPAGRSDALAPGLGAGAGGVRRPVARLLSSSESDSDPATVEGVDSGSKRRRL